MLSNSMGGKMISVVVPAYNEEKMVPKAAVAIDGVLNDAKIPHEIIFVDDGSKDTTWQGILKASEEISGVRGVHFSRNFGKEGAILAGLAKAKGDCSVVIDCDLQHPPEKIVEMYRLWEQGYEVVEGRKSDRGKESRAHSFAANTFYKIESKITGVDMANASDFKLLDKRAVDVIINLREVNSFFRALSSWVGFKTTYIEFEVQEREEGESKWNTWSLVKYAIRNIVAFSSAPMQIVTFLGVVMFIIGIVLGVIALVQKICGVALGGFTTVIIIQLFSSSIIMISLGIIGYYIAKIYDEVKDRPKYIVSKTCSDGKEENAMLEDK